MANGGQAVCEVTGKVRYASPKSAHNATVGVRNRRHQRTRDSKPLETPYQCEHCSDYHLGRRYNDKVKR